MNGITEVGQEQDTSPVETIMQKVRGLRSTSRGYLIGGGVLAAGAMIMERLAEHSTKSGVLPVAIYRYAVPLPSVLEP